MIKLTDDLKYKVCTHVILTRRNHNHDCSVYFSINVIT